jgi:hypothetical protein
MLRKSILAAVSLAMLAVGAPPSHAAPTTAQCGGVAFAQKEVTGGSETYTGTLYGYAVFDDLGTHTFRCYVTVDGAEQSATPTQSGSSAIAAAGQVTFSVSPGQTVVECLEIDGATLNCHPVDMIALGPLPSVRSLVDPILCPILQSLAPGVPPVIKIESDGDLSVFTTGRLYDCPPYDN